MADKINNIIYNVEVDTKSGRISIDGLTKGFVDADRAVLKLQNDLNKNTKGVDKFTNRLDGASKAAGASTSATLELGRVLSDMPYGIRGVANNLQQLASNLFFMSKKTDDTTGKMLGFKGAVGSLLKGLIGPAGILIAFQGVIALLDHFSTSTKKAETDTRSFKEEVKELNTILGKQADHTILASETIEEYLDLLKMKREIDKQLNDLDQQREDTLGYIKNLKASIKTFKDKLALDEDNIYLQNKVIELEKLEQAERTKLNNIYLDGQNIIDNYKKAKSDLTKAEEGTLLALEQQKSALQKERKEVSKSSKQYKEYSEKIKLVQDAINEITGGKDGKRPKVEVVVDSKAFFKDSTKMVKITEEFNKKNIALLKLNNYNRLVIERDAAIKRIMALKGDNTLALAEMNKYYDALLGAARKAQLDGSLGGSPDDANAKRDKELTDKLDKMKEFANSFNEISSSVTSFMNGEFTRQMTIEQNKTNALNNELRERLNNENLSADERKSIQLKIARNDEVLRKKQEQIEKKRFRMNKAAQIAGALVNTAAAAAGVMADAKGGFFQRLGEAIPTIAFGLGQVAIIARQKFQSSAGATIPAGALGSGGSSGGGRGDRSFDFNLAGASRENQLAQTLQGRFDQPLQAYVVARDITNKQQLDEDIRNNASFG